MAEHGFIDFYGFHLASAGWFFCGWIPLTREQVVQLPLETTRVFAMFEGGGATADALVVFFARTDLGVSGTGIVLFMSNASRFPGRLGFLDLIAGADKYRLEASHGATQFRDSDLLSRLGNVLSSGFGGHRNEMMITATRRGFTGANTIEALTEPVKIGIDEVILCKPDGVVLVGWCLAAPGVIASLTLYVGAAIAEFNLHQAVRVDRLDVLDSVGASMGVTDRYCGFVAFLPLAGSPRDVIYLQVETRGREIGYLNLHTRSLSGMPAIRRILDVVDTHSGECRPAFEHVIGPALQRLNAERLQTKPGVSRASFGIPPAAPSCTIIIPLYGRIDFLEYQIGLMSCFPQAATWELIYVLDDPPRQRELEVLADSVFARFGIPFILLCLSENLGFAPANNVGLAQARGEYVCFLNSDVFPQSGDWVGRLCADLEANPDLGAVGGLLLFEDGSVQHEGMELEPIRAFGGFQFPIHRRKGWRPRPRTGLERMGMITGACMMMRRQFAVRLGGFDEAYIVGDFEDCDLCSKIEQNGKICAVDHDVRLYHLERRSQVTPDKRWRFNMTLYNAWVYETRWLAKRPLELVVA